MEDNIPAIVTRQESLSVEFVQVGFSSYHFHEGGRAKFRAIVPRTGITEQLSPFDVIGYIGRLSSRVVRDTLYALRSLAEEMNLDLGLYGSVALEIMTGLPYLHIDSDIDILVRPRDDVGLCPFYEAVNRFSLVRRIDIEALCKDGAGVKLAELCTSQKTVLCKGLLFTELRPITCPTLPL